MEFLVALGQDVEITVRPSRRRHGAVSLALGKAGHKSEEAARSTKTL